MRATTAAVVLGLLLVAGACGGGSDGGGGGSAAGNGGDGLVKSDAGGSTANITIAAKGEPKPGGALAYGVEAETDSMKPTRARWAISGLMYANAVFDPIAAYDKDGVPRPYLAEKIEPSADFKTWSITFRPGITFHNGEKLDAEAGRVFIDALKDSPLTGPAAEPIVEVVPTGPLSADIKLNVAWVAFPHIMTGQGGMIAAPAQIKDEGEDGARKPIGTGPFKLKEWIPDNHFTAVKNTDYWRKDAKGNTLPYLDQVEFRPLVDTQARLDSLNSHTVNIIHDFHGATVEKLREQANRGEIQFVLGGGEDEEAYVLLNTKSAPLDDVRVRRALAHATNLDEYFSVTQEDPSLKADGPFNKDGKWYAPTGYPEFDLEKAKALVGQWEADHPGEKVSIRLSATPGLDQQAIAQLLKAQWEQAGIAVEFRTEDQVTFILGAVTGKYQADVFRQFGANDPDADYHFWTGKNAGEGDEFRLNFANHTDAQLDEALLKGRTSPNEADRKAAYATVAQRMGDQVPYLWLQHVRWSIAADTTVRDFLNGPLPDGTAALPVQAGVHRLTHAWIES